MSVAPIEGQGSEQEVVTQGTPVENSQQEGTGINPAWTPLLEKLPSSLHSLVTPELTKWDQNYQNDIGKVHSQYEPWKPFIDGGINPEQVQQGVQLLNMLEENPQQLFDSLKEYLQIEDETPVETAAPGEETEQGQESPIDITNHPQFQQLTQMVNTMAELLVQQSTQESNQKVDQELEQEFTAAKEQHGEFDEEWVMAKILASYERGQDLSVSDAAKMYKEFERSLLTNANRPGPKVLGAGGGTANPGANPSQLDDKGRRAMVAEMLAASKQQAG